MNVDYEIGQQVTETAPLPFAINSAERANWLVRKIVECRAYGLRAREFAEREQHRAAREERTLLYLFGRQLESWATNAISGSRRKSISLPSGTIGFRLVKSKLVVDDEMAVLDWAKKHCPKAVVTVDRLKKSVIISAMQTTGVIPDKGAHVEPETERFFIR